MHRPLQWTSDRFGFEADLALTQTLFSVFKFQALVLFYLRIALINRYLQAETHTSIAIPGIYACT